MPGRALCNRQRARARSEGALLPLAKKKCSAAPIDSIHFSQKIITCHWLRPKVCFLRFLSAAPRQTDPVKMKESTTKHGSAALECWTASVAFAAHKTTRSPTRTRTHATLVTLKANCWTACLDGWAERSASDVCLQSQGQG